MKTKSRKILLIDDDLSLSTVVSHQLKNSGYAASVANDGQSGIEAFRKDTFDLCLIDLQMPDMHGMDVLKRIRQMDESVPVIIITAYGTVENAIEACHRGADDYLTKPFAKEQLLFAIEKALRLKNLEKDNKRLREEVSDRYQFGNILTQNKGMHDLLQVAERAAKSDASVLILGESGTGKELLARAIHHNSPRKEKPLIAVNCPSIPDTLIESELFGHEKGAFTGAIQAKPGKFELANGGTIFLDEVGDLKLDLQAKLLRVLQEHEVERVGSLKPIPVDVRVIAATNQDLKALVDKGRFREDLYYRLNVIPLRLPSLRERKDDIPLLVDHFIQKHSDVSFTPQPDFMQTLLQYDWPGNVRELENAIHRAVILCPDKELKKEYLDLSTKVTQKTIAQFSTLESLADIEREAIVAALKNNNWNQSHAARQLEIPRHVLIYRMKKLGIKRKAQRA